MLGMLRWRRFLKLIRILSLTEERFHRRMHNLLLRATEAYDQGDQYWRSHILRPKRPEANESVLRTETQAAIVLQGPLRLADDFTLQTVRHYRSSMPGSQVIVSTWKGEDANTLKAIEQAGGIVVLSDQPEYAGSGNVNRQIVTTRAGIELAQELRFPYVMKSRTDTRINNYHVLDYLVGLTCSFPMRRKVAQHGRLVVLDYATRLLIPNHPSDILMFGHTSDMLAYWQTPLSLAPPRNPQPANVDELWDERTPEVYLCESYLRRIKYPVTRNVTAWWKTLAELFVVVDRASIDHFWPKYGYTSEHRTHIDAADRVLALCGFAEWVNLYAFRKTLAVSEEHVRLLPCDALVHAA
jgi:hypothetical protein